MPPGYRLLTRFLPPRIIGDKLRPREFFDADHGMFEAGVYFSGAITHRHGSSRSSRFL